VFSLQDYRTKKNEILSNDKLSQKGKDDAIAKLERQYKDDARKSVKALRKEAVITALKLRDLQEKRFEKIKEAKTKVDYARLNYEAQRVQSQIMSSDNLSDVEVAFRDAKVNGDEYALKAWGDVSEGLINSRFGGDGDYTDFRGELLGDIKSHNVDLAKVDYSTEEVELRNELVTIENQANEINQVYGSGQSVINRVFDGIGFENNKVTLGFDYGINKLSDKREHDFEVFNRLEDSYEKSINEYQNILKSKGFDGEVDGDFDDFKGVF
jgi:hypothetical protein